MLKNFFYANLEEKSDGHFDWKFSKQGVLETLWKARTLNQWTQFDGLKMPTLLMRGERSEDLPAELYEEILRRNPRIEGRGVPGAGHWVHAEKPKETTEILESFL